MRLGRLRPVEQADQDAEDGELRETETKPTLIECRRPGMEWERPHHVRDPIENADEEAIAQTLTTPRFFGFIAFTIDTGEQEPEDQIVQPEPPHLLCRICRRAPEMCIGLIYGNQELVMDQIIHGRVRDRHDQPRQKPLLPIALAVCCMHGAPLG